MLERSCRRTASAHASMSALIWVSAVWPCFIMAVAPSIGWCPPLGRMSGRISDTRASFFVAGRAAPFFLASTLLLLGQLIAASMLVSAAQGRLKAGDDLH